MANSTWLDVSQISKSVWRILDAGMVNEYLVEGEDRALLIDCGWGIGDLAKVVASLTSLPLTIVNTHGHPDHTCGDYRFGGVFIHEGDVPMLKRNYDPAVRAAILRRFPKHTLPDGFSEHAWINAPLPHYTPVKTRSFDLGGRILDVIGMPGHTPGSICLYDHNERTLFSGDNIISGDTLLNLPDSLPLAVYLESIDKLAAMADKFDRLLPAHEKVPLDPGVLKEMQAGVRKILGGEVRGTPRTMRLGSGLSCHFGGCGILYREDRLR